MPLYALEDGEGPVLRDDRAGRPPGETVPAVGELGDLLGEPATVPPGNDRLVAGLEKPLHFICNKHIMNLHLEREASSDLRPLATFESKGVHSSLGSLHNSVAHVKDYLIELDGQSIH